MKNSMEVTSKAKNRLTIWYYNPTPGHIPEKALIWKDTCTSVFIATLFYKTWIQPKCPLTDDGKRRCGVCVCIYIYICTIMHTIYVLYIYIYNLILFKEWNISNTIYSNMDGPKDCHAKWSKPDRERQLSHVITYMWNFKKRYKWTYLQNINTLTDIENKLMVTKGKWGDG